jgi:serine/threonine-protein kinase
VAETQELIDSRYRLTELLAGGGMGQVWRAKDQLLGRRVAVKLLHHASVDTADAAARFRAEARAMATLRHSGVAEVYDYGEATRPDGTVSAYIVMALVEGQPLSERIRDTGGLDAVETASIVVQAARALQAVHDAGVVHRDVKPGNLVVDSDGHVVLVDFGVAVTAGAPGLTGTHEVVGTALYMAPEQVAKRTITPATDIYALGAVAYHCLAGRPPFVGDNPVTVAMRHLDEDPPPLPDDVPTEVRDVVGTAMAKDPARRYPTAAAMADAVSAAVLAADVQATVRLAPAPGSLTPAAPGDDVTRTHRRGPLVAAALACVAALLAVLAFADPAGVIHAPWENPDPPAATTDPTSDPGTGPAGGSNGQSSSPSGTARTSTATPPGAAAGVSAGPGSTSQQATPPPADKAGAGPPSIPTTGPTGQPQPSGTIGGAPSPGPAEKPTD